MRSKNIRIWMRIRIRKTAPAIPLIFSWLSLSILFFSYPHSIPLMTFIWVLVYTWGVFFLLKRYVGTYLVFRKIKIDKFVLWLEFLTYLLSFPPSSLPPSLLPLYGYSPFSSLGWFSHLSEIFSVYMRGYLFVKKIPYVGTLPPCLSKN